MIGLLSGPFFVAVMALGGESSLHRTATRSRFFAWSLTRQRCAETLLKTFNCNRAISSLRARVLNGDLQAWPELLDQLATLRFGRAGTGLKVQDNDSARMGLVGVLSSWTRRRSETPLQLIQRQTEVPTNFYDLRRQN